MLASVLGVENRKTFEAFNRLCLDMCLVAGFPEAGCRLAPYEYLLGFLTRLLAWRAAGAHAGEPVVGRAAFAGGVQGHGPLLFSPWVWDSCKALPCATWACA